MVYQQIIRSRNQFLSQFSKQQQFRAFALIAAVTGGVAGCMTFTALLNFKTNNAISGIDISKTNIRSRKTLQFKSKATS